MGLLSTAILIGLGIFGQSEEKRFESLAAKDIDARLQGIDKLVRVNVRPSGFEALSGRLESASIFASDFSLRELPLFTEPDRSQSGKIDLLQLRLSRFKLRGLRIEELSADIPDCRYDFGLARSQKQIRLSRSGVGSGTVRINENDLAEYLVEKYSEIKSCKVKVYNDVVWVEGYGEFLIVKTNFAVIAKISVEDGVKLNLSDAKIYFDWRRADSFSGSGLLKTLNPVVDLEKDLGLFDAVYVESVRLRDGVLEAKGKTKIPVKPADN